MKAIRWLACFPGAMATSLLVWIGLMATGLLNRMYYGPGIYVLGITPLILKTSISAVAFVVAGVLLSPSKGRKVAFSFFGLAILFSGGAIESLKYQDEEVFWVGSFLGTILGGLIGLGIALRLQTWRKLREQNQTSKP